MNENELKKWMKNDNYNYLKFMQDRFEKLEVILMKNITDEMDNKIFENLKTYVDGTINEQN